jgi:uncharacterized membrane protein YczE
MSVPKEVGRELKGWMWIMVVAVVLHAVAWVFINVDTYTVFIFDDVDLAIGWMLYALGLVVQVIALVGLIELSVMYRRWKKSLYLIGEDVHRHTFRRPGSK